MNHLIAIVFFTCVVLAGRSCLRDNTEQEPRGAKISVGLAHTEMADADKRWHNYRAESIRLKLAGRDTESESYDRLANTAYDNWNMYHHRIQSGNFSRIPTAAEEQAIQAAEAADKARRASDAAADAYAIWVAKADAIARAAGFADWRAKANADEEIVRLASAAKLKSDADAAEQLAAVYPRPESPVFFTALPAAARAAARAATKAHIYVETTK